MTERTDDNTDHEADVYADETDGIPSDPCPYCGGVGGDPLDDFVTPCPVCDGEGTRWWT